MFRVFDKGLMGVCVVVFISFIQMSCLGKTVAKQVYYISPKKKTVYFGTLVNYTDEYLLGDEIRNRLKDYFNSQIRFGVVEHVDDSDLYVLLYIYDYQIQDVKDYGFGNRAIQLQSGLFVSDTSYRGQDQKDEKGRYYFNDHRLNIEWVDEVREGDSFYTDERLVDIALERLVVSVYQLMLSGQLPSSQHFFQ